MGMSYGHPNAQAAKAGAVAGCQKQHGGRCQAMLSFSNQCAAVANAGEPGQDSANTGSSQAEAEANAMKSCRADWGVTSCTVGITGCSKHGTRVVR